MEKPSLEIGNNNWAIKDGELLGYNRVGNDYLPIPITMTRASLGTRVNPQGLVEDVELLGSEEITNGDFATDSDWTKGTGITISGGSANFTGNANQNINQGTSMVNGVLYKATFSVSNYTSGKISINLGGSTRQGNIEANGDYVFYITSSGAILYFQEDFSLGFVGSIDNVSVKEATIDNLARVDYNGTSSLLAEPQRTNLITYSEDFSQSYWTKQSGVTPTYNTTETLSPDGTYNATKFIGNGSSGVFKGGISVTGVIARSVYLKSITGTVNVVLKDPNLTVTQKTLTVTEEWQRFELIESNGTSTQGIWIDDIPASGIYIWGAQLEEGSYATSYIKTSGQSGGVTRVQDKYEKTGISNLINSTEGVLFVEMAALSDDETNREITLSDGTVSNYVLIRFNSGGSNRIYTRVDVGGAVEYYDLNTNHTITNNNKIAIRWGANNFATFINGVEAGSQLSGSSFSADTLNNLSFDNGAGAGNFYGKVKQLQVFKTALTDDELTILTGTSGVHFFPSYAGMASALTYTIE